MLQSKLHIHHHFLFPHLPISLPSSPILLNFVDRPTIPPHTVSVSAISPVAIAAQELGTIFGAIDDPSVIQISGTVLVTAAITVFVFPSLQRRIKRAKQLKYRSNGVKKKALNRSKVNGSSSIKTKKRASADQALLGAVIAGVIALLLYKFTTNIQPALYRQSTSDNFSVRQITITIRTIINGLCYLATFVYGLNSIGLLLYSGQLAINTYMGESTTTRKNSENTIIENSSVENLTNSNKLSSTKEEDQNSNSS